MTHVIDVLAKNLGAHRKSSDMFHPMLRDPNSDGRSYHDLRQQILRCHFCHKGSVQRIVYHVQMLVVLFSSSRRNDGCLDRAGLHAFAKFFSR